MAAFLVMKRAPDAGDDGPLPIFVRDGFSFPAFLVPPLWLLWHRLWVEAGVALLLVGAIGWLGEPSRLGPAGGLLSLLVSIYVGLEGGALRSAAQRRRGWTALAVVEAESADDARIRYLADTMADAGPQSPDGPPLPGSGVPIAAAAMSGPAASKAPALGLLSYPGRR